MLNNQRLKIQSQHKSTADRTGEITAIGIAPEMAMVIIRLAPVGDKTSVSITTGLGNKALVHDLNAQISEELEVG